jgi:hypothetical protein
VSLLKSRFSPDETSRVTENSQRVATAGVINSHLVKDETDSYVSFHAAVNDEDFLSFNSTGMWPNGRLIAPP